MTYAYDEKYLSCGMENLGEALDYAVNACHVDMEDFMRLFISTGFAEKFGDGNPKVIAGFSGTELALEVLSKAGTIILLSTVVIWFTSYFGFAEDGFRMLADDELHLSILAKIGGAIAWIFAPLGFGTWQAAVASITGLVAKENIVGTMGILYGTGDSTVWHALSSVFTGVTGYSFLVFNLLCAPCFAAIGAIRREMNSPKWTWFAILYQCGFAYAIALMINQFGNVFTGNINVVGFIFALLVLAFMIYMLLRKNKQTTLK